MKSDGQSQGAAYLRFLVLTQFAKQLVSHVKSQSVDSNTGAASNT